MKKIIALILAVGLIVSICACAGQESVPSASETSVSMSSASSRVSSAASSSGSESASASESFVTAPEVYEYPVEIPEDNEEFLKMITVDTQIPTVEANEDDIIVTGENELPVINNVRPLDELLYPTGLNTVMGIFANCDSPRGSLIHIHYNFMLRYPITFLRQTGEGRYYTVQKIENGGYLYLFLERAFNLDTGKYYSDDLTNVYVTGGVYMEKALTKSDFDSITVGSTIYDVMAIDNTAGMAEFYARGEISTTGKRIESILSKHLLKDGLLVYKYEYSGDTLVVTEISFSEDFVFKSPIFRDNYGVDYPKYFGILPQDYPQ